MSGTRPADPIAEAFEAHRDRLTAGAYRVLGSHVDAVQEAWLRLSRHDTDTIHNGVHAARGVRRPHGEIGAILGRSTDATKMLTSRARQKVHAARAVRERPTAATRGGRAFLAAAREGQFERLLEVLHPEVKFVVHTEDGRFVTLGATNVAARARVAGSAARGHAATVNGRPGVIS